MPGLSTKAYPHAPKFQTVYTLALNYLQGDYMDLKGNPIMRPVTALNKIKPCWLYAASPRGSRRVAGGSELRLPLRATIPKGSMYLRYLGLNVPI